MLPGSRSGRVGADVGANGANRGVSGRMTTRGPAGRSDAVHVG